MSEFFGKQNEKTNRIGADFYDFRMPSGVHFGSLDHHKYMILGFVFVPFGDTQIDLFGRRTFLYLLGITTVDLLSKWDFGEIDFPE